MTLIETLITVAIAGIILAWGLPNLADYVRTSRVVSTSNELVAALTAARTFSVTRSIATVVCASNNITDSSPGCTGSTAHWSSGWLVFEDCDGDNALDNSAVACSDGSRPETIIKAAQYLGSGTVITNANSGFSFSATGFPSGTQSFAICRSPRGRTVNLSASGRTEVTEANDPC